MARFQPFPCQIHVITVKINFKYIQGVEGYGMWYAKTREVKLKAYIDNDWAGNIDGRKSTLGTTLFLGNCLVSWVNKKEDSISLSIVEEKYIAAATCCSRIIWIRKKIKGYYGRVD